MHTKRIINYIVLKIGIFIYHRALMVENGHAERLEQILLKFGSTIALSKMRQYSIKPSTNKYAIHTLICKNDVNRYIISIYSLLRFLKQYPLLFIHEDGSITERQMKLLQTLPNVTVISHTLATKVCKNFYHDFTSIDSFRKIDPKVKKITDSICFINTQKVLILDSDIGFFQYPHAVVDYLDNNKTSLQILFMDDMQDAYATTRKNLRRIYNLPITPRVNCGLLCVSSNIVTKKFIEHFFTRLDRFKDTYSYFSEWIDQTPWALLTKLHASKRLSHLYYIGMSQTPQGVICRHYVHGSRHYFVKDMLRFIDDPRS